MLQDRDGGPSLRCLLLGALGIEVEDQRQGRLDIDEIVVGELLAVELLGDVLEERAVEGRLLMGVLPVTQGGSSR